ncbi:MAG TPA: sulfite exporter TauE/SafE family protein [Pseudonocardiaceae bacterium]
MTSPAPSSPAAPPSSAGRLAAIGVVAGFMSGLFGVGGGVLVVPALVALCKQDQRRAVATSLMAIGPLAISGLVGYAIHRQVDVYLAVPLVIGTVAGAWVGSTLLRTVSLPALRWLFAAATLAAAFRLVLDPGVPAGEVDHGFWTLALLVPIGLAVGVLSGLTGIGGGAVMVPIMQLGFAVPAALAKGTSLLVVLPTSLVSGVRNVRARLGSVRDAAWIGLSGMVAAFAASNVSVRLPQVVADLLFGLFLIFVALRTIWPDLRAWWARRSGPEPPPAQP